MLERNPSNLSDIKTGRPCGKTASCHIFIHVLATQDSIEHERECLTMYRYQYEDVRRIAWQSLLDSEPKQCTDSSTFHALANYQHDKEGRDALPEWPHSYPASHWTNKRIIEYSRRPASLQPRHRPILSTTATTAPKIDSDQTIPSVSLPRYMIVTEGSPNCV